MDDKLRETLDERYVVSHEVFEGPLDLLLHLIREHELDIFDIPISFITGKYLEYMDLMRELNLNMASEYLEMAAHLAFIKSRSMLPVDPSATGDELDLDDGPDPREELVRQLLEYQKYKSAAEQLASMPRLGRDTFPRTPDKIPPQDRDLVSPGMFSLMEALLQVLNRIEDGNGSSEISVTRMSVSARIHQVIDFLRERKRMPFVELFDERSTRSTVVVTFLAILEMTKLGLLRLHQAGPGAEIHILASSNIEESDKILNDIPLEDE